ncbi:hypothetical protein E2C01_092372 [Portunus trituberculatus]|uniref:Uncharacterized protein n=1 Tax=Portunus trituberculatus TaxID=210409 RepID=A0A5B7JGA3_PORTR|nr:hypothetical protein [Portunus trituberculatus]
METNRRKKSPSPSDDEYYDAFEESNAAASDSPLPPKGTSPEREDRRRDGGKGEEDNHLETSREGEDRPRDTRDSHLTHTLSSAKGENGSAASSSASPAELPSSFVDKFSSCSVTDSSGNNVFLTDSPSTTAEPSLTSVCSPLPGDFISSTLDTSLSLTDSIPSDDLDSTSNSSNAGSVSSTPTMPKKIVKKHSTGKWVIAAREVVQGGHSEERGFRRSSSSSSLSSGSDRKISSSSMLEDISQVRESKTR